MVALRVHGLDLIQDQALLIEEDGNAVQGEEHRVHCLQRHQVKSVLRQHRNAVFLQVQDHGIAVTFPRIGHREDERPPFAVYRFHAVHQVHVVIGFVGKRVEAQIVSPGNSAGCEVEGCQALGFPRIEDDAVRFVHIHCNVIILAKVRIDDVHEFGKVAQFHIRQVVHAVRKVQRKITRVKIIQAAEIERELLLLDLVRLPFRPQGRDRFGSSRGNCYRFRYATGKAQAHRHQNSQDSFHDSISLSMIYLKTHYNYILPCPLNVP